MGFEHAVLPSRPRWLGGQGLFRQSTVTSIAEWPSDRMLQPPATKMALRHRRGKSNPTHAQFYRRQYQKFTDAGPKRHLLASTAKCAPWLAHLISPVWRLETMFNAVFQWGQRWDRRRPYHPCGSRNVRIVTLGI